MAAADCGSLGGVIAEWSPVSRNLHAQLWLASALPVRGSAGIRIRALAAASACTGRRKPAGSIVSQTVACWVHYCDCTSWNAFFFAYVLTAGYAGTLPIYLVRFMSSHGQSLASMSAASTIAVAPVFAAGWIAQRSLVLMGAGGSQPENRAPLP